MQTYQLRYAFAGLFACVFCTTGHAQLIVDSGTPDESNHLAVFYNNDSSNSFVAQEFTLPTDTTVSQVEAYLGGGAFSDYFHIYLTTAVGAGPSVGSIADVVDSFMVAPPNTSPNEGEWTGLLTGNLVLPADTYYLVFATDVVGSMGGYMPVSAPNNIGFSYITAGQSTDLAAPYASEFLGRSSTLTLGVRVTGVPVPEPAPVLLLAGSLAILLCSRGR